jgi:hypothetical protein
VHFIAWRGVLLPHRTFYLNLDGQSMVPLQAGIRTVKRFLTKMRVWVRHLCPTLCKLRPGDLVLTPGYGVVKLSQKFCEANDGYISSAEGLLRPVR